MSENSDNNTVANPPDNTEPVMETRSFPFPLIFDASALKSYSKYQRDNGFPVYGYHLKTPETELRRTLDKHVTSLRFRKIFGDHTSERGWNLPKKHARHLLNFPIEILRRIMSFVLVAPCQVTPLAVPFDGIRVDSNGQNNREIQVPSYESGSHRAYGLGGESMGIVRAPSLPEWDAKHRQSFDGWRRKPIDATVLRVCKVLHQEGVPLLYGDNDFCFDLSDENLIYPSNSDIGSDADGNKTLRDRQMPGAGFLESDTIQDSIKNMMEKKDPRELDNWIFCDPFARFLHSIGPRNASSLRKLRMTGALFSSDDFSIGNIHYHYRGNIRYFLKAYSLFITQYCYNIEKFGIGVEEFCFEDLRVWEWSGRMNIDYPYPAAKDDPESEIEWFFPDPEDLEVQTGDEAIAAQQGEDVLKAIRATREKNYREKKAQVLLQIENNMANQYLKPLVDDISQKMKNLQVLEVKRYEVKSWQDMNYPTQHGGSYIESEYRSHPYVTWVPNVDYEGRPTQTWVDLEIADDAKRAVAIASLKRSKELEAAKQKTAPDGPKESEVTFASQLDLPDNPTTSVRRGHPFRRGGRGGRGRRGRGRSSGASQDPRPGTSPQGNQLAAGDEQGNPANTGGASQQPRGRGGRGRGRGRGRVAHRMGT